MKWSRQEEIEYRNPSRIDSSERNSRVNGWGIWERQGAVGQGIPKGEKVRRMQHTNGFRIIKENSHGELEK